MAFSTGTATSVTDLGNKLVTFATTNGWTQNGTTASQGTGIRFHLSKNNVYLNFRTFISETPSMNNGTTDSVSQAGAILCNLSTGYNGAQNWYNQTGFASYGGGNQTQTTGMVGISGSIPAYYFFTFSGTGYDVLYIVVEYSAGLYQYLLLGMLDKSRNGNSTTPIGLFSSGTGNHSRSTRLITNEFFTNTVQTPFNFNNYPTCSINTSVNTGFSGFAYKAWSSFSEINASSPTPISNIASYFPFIFNIPNSFSSTSPMFPIVVGCKETAGNYWIPFGELPNIYITNIMNDNPGSTITISSDTYKIFPFYQKDSTNSTYNTVGTGTLAYAIKY